MEPVKYFVALSFVRTEDGNLMAGEAHEKPSAAAAAEAARLFAKSAAGAVAFSRIDHLANGEFDDAVIIASFGDVPVFEDSAPLLTRC